MRDWLIKLIRGRYLGKRFCFYGTWFTITKLHIFKCEAISDGVYCRAKGFFKYVDLPKLTEPKEIGE